MNEMLWSSLHIWALQSGFKFQLKNFNNLKIFSDKLSFVYKIRLLKNSEIYMMFRLVTAFGASKGSPPLKVCFNRALF